MKIAITGGAGFIGSHIKDKLIEQNNQVIIVDDLSSGKIENISNAKLIKKSILNDITSDLEDVDTVFHFAADPEVRKRALTPLSSFKLNVEGTLSVLEAIRKADVKHIVFASTSTVYGQASIIPTPETYPATPISNYGASKLAAESYISSYSSTYGFKGTCLRYANIFGERSLHGVIYDFFHKLKKDPKKLEILGDGNQDKSYLYISDCVDATLMAWKKQEKSYDVFNIGSEEKITVNTIAKLVSKLTKTTPVFNYSGGSSGWIGDVPLMLLDITKIKKIGANPKITFENAVSKYITWLEATK